MRALDARIAKLKTQLAELEKARKVVEECEAEQLGQTFEAFGPSNASAPVNTVASLPPPDATVHVGPTPDGDRKCSTCNYVPGADCCQACEGIDRGSNYAPRSGSEQTPEEPPGQAPAPPPNNDVTPLDEKIRAGTVDVKSLVGRTVTFAGGSQRGIALPRGTIMQIVSFKRTPYERGDPVGRYLFTLSTLQKEHAIKFKEVGSESFRLQG